MILWKPLAWTVQRVVDNFEKLLFYVNQHLHPHAGHSLWYFQAFFLVLGNIWQGLPSLQQFPSYPWKVTSLTIRLAEWIWQCVGSVFGWILLIWVPTLDFRPTKLLASTYVCPRQLLSDNCKRDKASLI